MHITTLVKKTQRSILPRRPVCAGKESTVLYLKLTGSERSIGVNWLSIAFRFRLM
jgi:hypothetical protein